MAYVLDKIEHMQRSGIPANFGVHGGACPNWLTDERKADEKKRSAQRGLWRGRGYEVEDFARDYAIWRKAR